MNNHSNLDSGAILHSPVPLRYESIDTASVVTRVQVSTTGDPEERRIFASAGHLGITGLSGCRRWVVYHIEGFLSSADLARLCDEVLVDPVTDKLVICQSPDAGDSVGIGVLSGVGGSDDSVRVVEVSEDVSGKRCGYQKVLSGVGGSDDSVRVVEVAPLVGVTDVTARELERAAAILGLPSLRATTARRYELSGDLSDTDIAVLIRRLLVNSTIERSVEGELEPVFSPESTTALQVQTVRLVGLSDEELFELSQQRTLSLDVTEMKAIQAYFESCHRNPTDAELETLAQTWSEHCVHKTFKAQIHLTHTHADGRVEVSHHDGLLNSLRRVTAELDVPWLRSAFVDNAGIIAFDDQLDLAIKVETHNHPSALEPFGGANTGTGGVVRDIMGVSARPIACTDVLCFGPADIKDSDLPEGVLRPRRIRDGVVAGIGDYGNKLGLPTVNGAVIYDRGYVGNPLVFCGAVGLLPSGSHPIDPQTGDRIIAIGGRTGRDGIHGATFSSAGLDAVVADQASSAVQIGDPITEKGCMEVIERARDLGLYNAVTDCGAGGFSSAVCEMGAKLGAEIDLSTVPLKYPGLQPWEIWVSEAQERMVLAVPENKVTPLRELCHSWDVELSDIGTFTGTGRIVVRHGDSEVIDLPMTLLHDGIPRRTMTAVHQDPIDALHMSQTKTTAMHSHRAAVPVSGDSAASPVSVDPVRLILDLLAHDNVSSRESIVRTYDHEVRGGTVVRPFVGPGADGPSDAAVLKPLGTWHHNKAVALAVGINPGLTSLDPWVMALHAIDEAFRNLIVTGADPDRVALLDNFCWGNPTRPSQLGSLVRAVQGCVEGARRYRAPFISGKDSLYNEFEGTAVTGTLLISAVGVVPDMRKVVTSALTECGSDLWLVGHGSDCLGGSVVADLLGIIDDRVPPTIDDPLSRYRAVYELIAAGRVSAAHDVSDGGVAVCLAEMAIGGRLGLRVTIPNDLTDGNVSDGHISDTDGNVSDGRIGDSAGLGTGRNRTRKTRRPIHGNIGDSTGLVTALANEAPGRLILEAPTTEREVVAERLGQFGRRIGSVIDTDNIEIRVAGTGCNENTSAASDKSAVSDNMSDCGSVNSGLVNKSDYMSGHRVSTDYMVLTISEARCAFGCGSLVL